MKVTALARFSPFQRKKKTTNNQQNQKQILKMMLLPVQMLDFANVISK